MLLLCDAGSLPKAKQLCWSREDCLFPYNIESLVVKYLLLVAAYPQPKVIELGSTLIMGNASSDVFSELISERDGLNGNNLQILFQMQANHFTKRRRKIPTLTQPSVFKSSWLLLGAFDTGGWEGVAESGTPSSESKKMFGVTLSQSALSLCPSCC